MHAPLTSLCIILGVLLTALGCGSAAPNEGKPTNKAEAQTPGHQKPSRAAGAKAEDHAGHDHSNHEHVHDRPDDPSGQGHGETLEIEPVVAGGPKRLEDRELPDLLDELLRSADEGQSSITLVQHLGGRGMAAGLAAAERIDLEQPGRLAAQCEVIAQAGRSRRRHSQVLELYDPVAFEMFYGKDAEARQAGIGRLLDADEWPRELPAAVVTAAPLPALRWLSEQAKSSQPDAEKVRRLCRQWGQWARQNNERQYAKEIGAAIAALLAQPALAANEAAQADLLRAAGELRAVGCMPQIISALSQGEAQVRRQAASALGRLGADEALAALSTRASREENTEVLAEIAAALGNWAHDAQAGDAVKAIFLRSRDEQVRLAALYSTTAATWPQRTAILQSAFASPENGNLGVALLGLSQQSVPELRDAVLGLLQDLPEGQPGVIDALGAAADERGVPYLAQCLKQDPNGPLRMKAAFALEKIDSKPAREALLDALQKETDPTVMEHLVGIVGKLGLVSASPLLAELAKDSTAPMALRVQAIWSLGAFDTPTAHEAIETLSQDPAKWFGRADDPALTAGDSERIELASLFLAMARLRHGSPSAAAEIETIYRDGVATTQLSALVMLARLKIDHAVIDQGLESDDLAVLLSAVRAAGVAAPQKYRARLLALRDSPWIVRLLESSVDSLSLRRDLNAAIDGPESSQ